MIAIGYEPPAEQAIETLRKGNPGKRGFSPPGPVGQRYLPSAYGPTSSRRLKCTPHRHPGEQEELQEMAAELKTLWPAAPPENLLLVMRLRQLARAKGWKRLSSKRSRRCCVLQKLKV